jgi:hypothetical protein
VSRAGRRPAAPPLAALIASLTALGCAGPAPVASDLPADVPDPADVRISTAPGFRLYVDGGCLTSVETRALLDELVHARKRLEGLLGPHLTPGAFPRWSCPPEAAGVSNETIDVVVVQGGGRCHADEEGITIVRQHVARRDATHELVHYLCGGSWRPIDEGLAVYLTERLWGSSHGIPVKVRARVFKDLSLDTDLTHELAQPGMSRRDYDLAGAFVGWLLEAFDAERFWTLYGGAPNNFETAYGMSERDLWARFWRYVRNLDVKKDSAYYRYKDRLLR